MRTLFKIIRNVEDSQRLLIKSYGWRLTLAR